MLITHQIGPEVRKFANRQGDETIQEIIDRTGWSFNLPTICVVDGLPVLRNEWNTLVLPEETEVYFESRPRGGNSTLAFGAMIAVAVAATVLSAGLATPFILGAVGVSSSAILVGGVTVGAAFSAVAGAVVAIGGSLLVNAFLMPKPAQQDSDFGDTPPALLSAGSNQARPFDPIPVTYGRTIVYPDTAAPPYSEFHNDKQRLYVLLCLGLGKYDIEEIRADDTKLWDDNGGVAGPFTDSVKVEIVDPGEPINLFPFNVVSNPSVDQLVLDGANSDGNYGDYTAAFEVSDPDVEITKIMVDIIFPGGIYEYNNNGKLNTRRMDVQGEYREVGSSNWIKFLDREFSKRSREVIRFTAEQGVDPGHYEVRMRRKNKELSGDQGFDQVIWYALRGQIKGTKTFPDTTMIALQFDSDHKDISDTVQRRINVIATRKIPVWNGSDWVLQATRSPVWAAVDIWANEDYGAARGYDNLDMEVLEYYADYFEEREDYFDHTFRAGAPPLDAIQTALRVGFSVPLFIGNKLSMVRDEPRAVPTMIITDAHIKRGSFEKTSVFQSDDTADDVIIEFTNEDTWEADEVQATLKDSESLKPVRVRVDGVVNQPQAWRIARRLAATNRGRREYISVDMAADGSILRYGDWVRFTSEIPGTWGETSIVESYVVSERKLVVNPEPTWTGGQTYVEVRNKYGERFGPVQCSKGARQNIAILDASDLASVEADQGMSLAQALDRKAGSEYPTVVFGKADTQSIDCVVTGWQEGIENHGRLTLAIDDPRIYTIDGTEVVPTPNEGPERIPTKPIIYNLKARVKQRDNDPTLEASWTEAYGAKHYLGWASTEEDDEDRTWVKVYEGEKTRFEIPIEQVVTKVRVAAVGKLRGELVEADVSYPDYLSFIPTLTLTSFFTQGGRKDRGPGIKVEWDIPGNDDFDRYEGIIIEWWQTNDTTRVHSKVYKGKRRTKADVREGILRDTQYKFTARYIFRGGLEGTTSSEYTITATEPFDANTFHVPDLTLTAQTSTGEDGTQFSFFKGTVVDENDDEIVGIKVQYKKTTEAWADAVEKIFKTYTTFRLTEGVHRRQQYDIRAAFLALDDNQGNWVTFTNQTATNSVDEPDNTDSVNNEVYNWSFETEDTTTSTLASGWTHETGSGFTRQSGNADHGDYALGRSASGNVAVEPVPRRRVDTRVDNKWVATCLVKKTGTVTFNTNGLGLRIVFRNKVGSTTLIGTSISSGDLTGTYQTLQVKVASGEVPEDAYSVSVRVFVTNQGGSGTIWVDSVTLRRQNKGRDIESGAVDRDELKNNIALPPDATAGDTGFKITDPHNIINSDVSKKLYANSVRLSNDDAEADTLGTLLTGSTNARRLKGDKLEALSVSGAALAVDSVTNTKIANNAVDDDKIHSVKRNKVYIDSAGAGARTLANIMNAEGKIKRGEVRINADTESTAIYLSDVANDQGRFNAPALSNRSTGDMDGFFENSATTISGGAGWVQCGTTTIQVRKGTKVMVLINFIFRSDLNDGTYVDLDVRFLVNGSVVRTWNSFTAAINQVSNTLVVVHNPSISGGEDDVGNVTYSFECDANGPGARVAARTITALTLKQVPT